MSADRVPNCWPIVYRRISRVVLLAALFFLGLTVGLQAMAQEACTGYAWDDGQGYVQATGYAAACAEFEAWYEGYGGGREVTSCTDGAGGGSASVMNAGGVPGATGTWSGSPTPAGCGDPPPSYVSTVNVGAPREVFLGMGVAFLLMLAWLIFR